MRKLFESIRAIQEKADKTNDQEEAGSYVYDLYVKDRADFNEVEDSFFTISTKKEFQYAKSLEKFYTSVLTQVYETYGQFFSNSETGKKEIEMSRLFFVAGKLNEDIPGRSIHDTRSAFEVTRYASAYIDAHELKPDTAYETPHLAHYAQVAYDMAPVSRFNRPFSLPYRKVPIESIHFYLIYFKCYLEPLLEKFNRSSSIF
jgi:hypothetical protein